MPRERRIPWYAIDVDIRTNEKLVALPNDSARYGWIAAVLAEGKRQSRPGQFLNRGHLVEAIGRFGRHVPDYIAVGLLEESPKVCERCRKDFGELSGGRVVIHDWWVKQRDPAHHLHQRAHRERDPKVRTDNLTLESQSDEESDAKVRSLSRARGTTTTTTEDSLRDSVAKGVAAKFEDVEAFLKSVGYRRVTKPQRRLLEEIADREGWPAVLAWMQTAPDGVDPVAHLKTVSNGTRTTRVTKADARVAEHERTKATTSGDAGPIAASLAASMGAGYAPPRRSNGIAKAELVRKFSAIRGTIADEQLAAQLARHGLTLDDLEAATP